MSDSNFPAIDAAAVADTRDAIHAYARILGNCLKTCRAKRKHWWHASLRPSLSGLGTGIIRSTIDFELELDLIANQLAARAGNGQARCIELRGQSASELAGSAVEALQEMQVSESAVAAVADATDDSATHPNYSAPQAVLLGQVLRTISTAMETFRAGIREETSPIQTWPHHFDLSMIWLPGELIPGQDPANEEYADKQMNFGFGFGDDNQPEPYFYVTAYPTPDGLPDMSLPPGSHWNSEGFNGVLLYYRDLINQADPGAYLQGLWTLLLDAGRTQMLDSDS